MTSTDTTLGPQAGDLVENIHAPHLDWRTVTRVEGGSVYLAVGSGEIGPIDADRFQVITPAADRG